MTRHATRWVTGGTLAVALLVPGLVLGAGHAGAGVAVKAAPEGFCADMTKVAEAGVTFTKHPSAAAGHEVVATVEAAAKFTSGGASGELMGRVAPAIAATEAQYGEMWAQDAAAMYGYADPSTAKSTAELVAVDDYVTRACPSSAKVFRALKALEKRKGTTNR